VLRTWGDLTRGDVPDELATLSRFFRLPQAPEFPAEIRGKSFALVEVFHIGDPAQADALLAPLRALGPVNDTIRTVAVPELLHLHMDPEQPVTALGDGLLITRLPDEAIGTAVPGDHVELDHGRDKGQRQPDSAGPRSQRRGGRTDRRERGADRQHRGGITARG
jgi:hypothetical protein